MNDKTEQSVTDALVPATQQFQGRDGVWHNFVDDRHLQNTAEDGSWPMRNLYTQEAIDTLRAQLAEARRNAERWDRAAHCVRLDQFGGFVVTPDEPALDSDISLAFTREIDASIDAARGEKNGA